MIFEKVQDVKRSIDSQNGEVNSQTSETPNTRPPFWADQLSNMDTCLENFIFLHYKSYFHWKDTPFIQTLLAHIVIVRLWQAVLYNTSCIQR